MGPAGKEVGREPVRHTLCIFVAYLFILCVVTYLSIDVSEFKGLDMCLSACGIDRIQQLEREIARYKDDSSKAQAEVDRLLEILKEVENEKNDKDKKIAELER